MTHGGLERSSKLTEIGKKRDMRPPSIPLNDCMNFVSPELKNEQLKEAAVLPGPNRGARHERSHKDSPLLTSYLIICQMFKMTCSVYYVRGFACLHPLTLRPVYDVTVPGRLPTLKA